ncbi:DUF4271 domain-containing protein [Hyunsoonleella pacifica]|uniref:DUF4271 domain-containing protein n=1 Tax=Hyunsoonleella pacifica TaxID=1080224 RepID=A0A4Q9FMX3_9FLAO|nr:DUF4271 domain-containing protein [Hyunsoonleella pacifica]TBN15698.1 DUF4271 domain-containing protein [Hyunsoonleella pacifica]GGD21926.1 DUF4271 domain-containing protein [Hyunsoonleella pacifica]
MLREVPSHTLYTILLLICLVTIAIAKTIAPKRFNEFIMVISNSRYLKIYGKDQKFLDYYDGLLFLNLIISGTIFCMLCIENFTNSIEVNNTLLVKFVIGSGVFMLAKVLLERLIASLFEIDDIIDDYLFQKISYKNYLGILLLPVNAILIFSITPSKILLYLIFSFLFIVNISGLFTTFKTYQNEIKNNFFYFILYLCALEIAPYVIIYAIFSA